MEDYKSKVGHVLTPIVQTALGVDMSALLKAKVTQISGERIQLKTIEGQISSGGKIHPLQTTFLSYPRYFRAWTEEDEVDFDCF